MGIGCSTLTSQVGINCEGFYSVGAASEEYSVNDSVKAAAAIGYSLFEAAVTNDLILCLLACLPACPTASIVTWVPSFSPPSFAAPSHNESAFLWGNL